MLKNVGDGIHTAVTAADAGTLAYGSTTSYGLKNGGVVMRLPRWAQDRCQGPGRCPAPTSCTDDQLIVVGTVILPSETCWA